MEDLQRRRLQTLSSALPPSAERISYLFCIYAYVFNCKPITVIVTLTPRPVTCQDLLGPGSTALLPHPGSSFPHLPGPTRAGGCPRLCPVVPGCPGFLPGRAGPERRPRCRSRCGPHAVSMATAARAFPSAPPPSWLPLTAIPAAIPAPQRPESGSFSPLLGAKNREMPQHPSLSVWEQPGIKDSTAWEFLFQERCTHLR